MPVSNRPGRKLVRKPRLTLAWIAANLTLALSALSAMAQNGKPSVVPSAPPPAEQKPTDYKVPLLTQGLRLADFPDMAPRDGLKDKLLKIDGFTQNQPNNDKPPTQKTDVYIGRTQSTLYFVFICHDDHPGEIRSHLARRENITTDDNVGVLLDAFQDKRKGILFQVNPVGVQADGAWTEGNGADYSYDVVWDSDGRVTKTGWMGLIAIPFRSLRFRADASGWGVVFMRSIPRESETDEWPRISASISGTLTQEGTLRGIEGVTGSHNIQLNPYGLLQNEKTLDQLDPLNPYFSSRKFEGTAGGEAKAVIKDSIVVDATVNPDFSDIESDQPQFTVNQRYEVYFPELRPFFLENANYFATPINLVYTRNIVHPEFGVRVTGKLGHTNLGLLAIDDREPGDAVGQGDPLYKKRALFAVGRVSQDLGLNSSVGLTYTDEEFGSGWNRIGGFDFTARIDDHWKAIGQAVESSTKGTLDAPGYAAGPATYFEFNRSGHSLNFDDTFQDNSTGFQSQVGFINITDIRQNQAHFSYQWFTNKPTLQSYVLELNQQFAYDHQGNRVFRYSEGDIALTLARNTVVAPIFGNNSDTVGPQDGYPQLMQNLNFSENYAGVVFRSAPYSQLHFNFQATRSGNVNYYPAGTAPPAELDQQTVQFLMTVQPIRSLTADETYLLDRDHLAATGADVYENQTLRTKINYQFTKAFSARVIVEYDSLLVNPLQTSLVRTKEVQTEALLTWLPHPGTAIYLGYNNDLQNLDHDFCTPGQGGMCNPNNPILPRSTQYLNDGRQIFLKASYLFRF